MALRLSQAFMAMTFVVLLVYGVFAAAFLGLGAKIALTDR